MQKRDWKIGRASTCKSIPASPCELWARAATGDEGGASARRRRAPHTFIGGARTWPTMLGRAIAAGACTYVHRELCHLQWGGAARKACALLLRSAAINLYLYVRDIHRYACRYRAPNAQIAVASLISDLSRASGLETYLSTLPVKLRLGWPTSMTWLW